MEFSHFKSPGTAGEKHDGGWLAIQVYSGGSSRALLPIV